MPDTSTKTVMVTNPKLVAHRKNATRYATKLVEQVAKCRPAVESDDDTESQFQGSVLLNSLLILMEGAYQALGPLSEDQINMAFAEFNNQIGNYAEVVKVN